MSLGSRIRSSRLKAGLNQRAVAEAVNVSTQSVSLWENDKSTPELFRVTALANLFEVDWAWLLGRPGPEQPPASKRKVAMQDQVPVIDPWEIVDFYNLSREQDYVLRLDQQSFISTSPMAGQTFAIVCGPDTKLKGCQEHDILVFNNFVEPKAGDIVAGIAQRGNSFYPVVDIYSEQGTIDGLPTTLSLQLEVRPRSAMSALIETDSSALVIATAVELRRQLRWAEQSTDA